MESQSVVVRFAGDSGDGVQLMGTQFVAATALAGDDFATFPDYPAEIRAPAGTTFGVSAYQIHLGARPITTAGDAPHVLVAFNPAALKVNLPLVADGALIVLNIDSFTTRGLAKAGYQTDPRPSGVLDGYQVVEVDITKHTMEATAAFGFSKSDAGRCKNLWALGLVQWMFSRDVASIEKWINGKFAKDPTIRDANVAALRAGHAYGETAELTAALPHVGTTPPSSRRANTAACGAAKRCRSAWPRPASSRTSRSCSARIRLRRHRRCCISLPGTATSAWARSRPRTRSRPSAQRSARHTAEPSASRRAPAPALR